MPEPTDDRDSRFAACLAQVLAREGGYVDNPADPGGATNLGITRRTLAAWRGVVPWTSLPKADVAALQRSEAAALYRSLFWQRCGGDALPAGLDLAVFDFAVNSGPDRAVRTLQGLLRVTVDGIPGPVTLGSAAARAGAGGVPALVSALCDERLRFLRTLSTYATFGRGWTSRVAATRTAALAMASSAPQSPIPTRRTPMDILAGYRTYIVAGLMLLAGLAQLIGVPLPALDGQSAGHLLMEAFAVIFLRRGLTTEAAKG